MSEEIRAFIAFELPDSLKESLMELQRELKGQVPQGVVRWTRPEGIHLTLKFLGQTPVDQIEDIAEALSSACAPFSPLTYTASGLGCFPNLRRPRVIWVGIEDPAGELSELQKAVEDACVESGFERERRAFHPHLTLGRVRRRASRGQRRAISELLQEREIASLGTVTVRKVSLIRSELRPTGAVYTTLREVKLHPSPT
ncbi:MAG: RNA 2',3'-cyclic phosphodiesterase [Chloroflexota bacterium]|nr:RNA 2',3'-cyclic phosphodiesterase [Chloroflexota bacterium]